MTANNKGCSRARNEPLTASVVEQPGLGVDLSDLDFAPSDLLAATF